MLPEVYSFNDKLLIYNGALAIDPNCCCGDNLCCWCADYAYYYYYGGPIGGNTRRLGILGPPNPPGKWFCSITWRTPGNTFVSLNEDVLVPPEYIFVSKFCNTGGYPCRFMEYVWNTADNKDREPPFGQQIYGRWYRGAFKYTACIENYFTREECVRCRELETTPEPGEEGLNEWLRKLSDLCGNYRQGDVQCCLGFIQEWPNGCDC